MEASVHLFRESLRARRHRRAAHSANAGRRELVADGEVEPLLFFECLGAPRKVGADSVRQRERELPEIVQRKTAVVAIAEVTLSSRHAGRAIVSDKWEEARFLLFRVVESRR